MTEIINAIMAHPVIDVVAGAPVFIAAVNALCKPGEYRISGGFYGWVYRFLNALTPLAQSELSRHAPNLEAVETPKEQPKEK